MNNNTRVWVLGNGQLGFMLRHAGDRLGLRVNPIDIMDNASIGLELHHHDIVTAEREEWPQTQTSIQLSQHSNFINAVTFTQLANRLTQKQLLDELAIPTAPWLDVNEKLTSEQLHQQLGSRVLLKRCRGGYDGKGQHWLKQSVGERIPDGWHNQSIAEQGIDFDEEVSLIGARTQDGQFHFFPLTLNYHQNGILMASIAPVQRLNPLQHQAQTMLTRIMDKLDYVGVMAMECFRIGDKLLVNELAPRVHNSGHWTQAGAHIDQFELHLRAICHLPIAELTLKKPIVMINLIGVEMNLDWLTLASAELFWYNKAVREGRKLGHINLTIDEHIETSLQQLAAALPASYNQALTWVANELNTSYSFAN